MGICSPQISGWPGASVEAMSKWLVGSYRRCHVTIQTRTHLRGEHVDAPSQARDASTTLRLSNPGALLLIPFGLVHISSMLQTVRQPSDRRGPMRTRRTGIHRYIGKAPLLERRLTRRSLHERSTKCYEYFASFGKKVKEGRFKSVVGYPHRAHISVIRTCRKTAVNYKIYLGGDR